MVAAVNCGDGPKLVRRGRRRGEGEGGTGRVKWEGRGKLPQGKFESGVRSNITCLLPTTWSHAWFGVPQVGDEGKFLDINMRRIF